MSMHGLFIKINKDATKDKTVSLILIYDFGPTKMRKKYVASL